MVPGYGVASGRSKNIHFPGGTLAMQLPFFEARGLDLNKFYRGTLNVSVAPRNYRILNPFLTFRQVKWHPTEPAEDFSFLEVRLTRGEEVFSGWIYYPHPETKPRHFQAPDVLELLLPFVPGISSGDRVHLEARTDQIALF